MFLKKLDYLMEQKAINRHTLAAQAGIPYTTIVGLYKKGYENVKLTTLKALASYFDVSIDFLVCDNISIEGYFMQRHEDEMIEKYRQLDQRGKAAVNNTLEHEYQAMLGETSQTDPLPRPGA